MALNLGFRSKLLAGTVGLIVGFVATTAAALSMLIEQSAERQIARDLNDGQRSYHNYMTLKWRSLRDNAAFLAQSPRLTASAGTRDPATVEDVLRTLEVPQALSFVVVADGKGRVLGSTQPAPPIPRDLVGLAGMARTLEGHVGDAVWRLGEELCLVATAPLIEREGLVGVVLIGERIDDDGARQIGEVAARDVLLLHQDSVVGQAWRDDHDQQLSDTERLELLSRVAGADLRAGLPLQLALAGRPRLALAIPMREDGGDGILVLSQDLEEATGLHRAAQVWLLALGVAFAVMGVLFSFGLSARLARPLRALMGAADAMTDGDLQARVAVTSRDDVGRLARSFNRMAGTIEHLVAEVRQEAERAEAANRAKDSFLTCASHELRTPLTGIQAATEVLSMYGSEASGEERAEFLGILEQETGRLGRLIGEILDYARIESHQLDWNVTELNVPELLRSLANDHREAAQEKGVALAVHAEVDRPYRGDGECLGKALAHLIDNALRYAPAGSEVVVTARCRRASDRDQLEIGVSDRGPGIPGEQAKELIFERFHQGGDTLTDKPPGAGLGLAICREIVAAHGGRLWCEDNPGGGARFVVLLPEPIAADPRPVDVIAVQPEAVDSSIADLLADSGAHPAMRRRTPAPGEDSAATTDLRPG